MSRYHARVTVKTLLALLVGLSACSDPGDDWKSKPTASSITQVTDVWAFSETDVWFLDGSNTVQRFDGSDYVALETPSTGGLGCIFALSINDVWLCAGSDVLHYDGTNFTVIDASAVGMDGFSGLWASSASDIFVIGEDAVVGHYDGSSWSRTIAGSPFNSSIWGSGPSDVYALGTFSLIHYDGASWTEIDLDGGGGDGQVWGTSASDVWVMTESYELSHFTGSAWETIETADFVGDLAAVWGPSPDDLWAAGSAGSIAHYNGSKWTELTHQKIGAPYLRQFTAIHGSSSSNIWIVGYQLGEGGSTPQIYRYEP